MSNAKAASSSASVAVPVPPGTCQVIRGPPLCAVGLPVGIEAVEQRLVVHVDGDQHAVRDTFRDRVVAVLGALDAEATARRDDEPLLPVVVGEAQQLAVGLARELAAVLEGGPILQLVGAAAARERRLIGRRVRALVERHVVDPQVVAADGARVREPGRVHRAVERELDAERVGRHELRRLALRHVRTRRGAGVAARTSRRQ